MGDRDKFRVWQGFGAVFAFVIALPVGLAVATESFGIPHFDDWAFSRIALDHDATGEVHLVGSNAMMLIGQIAVSKPFVEVFGADPASLNAFGAVTSAIALLAVFLLARRFLPSGLALLTTLLVGVAPGFGPLVATYMTDPPAFAASALCLVIGLAGLDRSGRSRICLIAVALLLGLLGFTIREFAIAAPLAVLIAWGVQGRREGARTLPVALSAIALFCCAALLYAWRHTLEGDTSLEPPVLGPSLVFSAALSYFTIVIAALPAIVLMAPRIWARRSDPGWVVASVGAGLLGAGTLLYPIAKGGDTTSLFLGYVFNARGPWGNQALLGDRAHLIPLPGWVVLHVVALIAGALLAGYVGARLTETWKQRTQLRGRGTPAEWMLVSYGVVNIAGIGLLRVIGGPTYERYLWPLILVTLIFLFRQARELGADRMRPAALGATGVLSVVSLALVISTHSFGAARWEAGERAVELGYAPRTVDAGLEWVGFHYEGLANEEDVAQRWRDPVQRYMDDFPRVRNCVVVAASELDTPGLKQLFIHRYRPYLLGEQRTLYVYRNGGICE